MRCKSGILILKTGAEEAQASVTSPFYGWCLKPRLQIQGHSNNVTGAALSFGWRLQQGLTRGSRPAFLAASPDQGWQQHGAGSAAACDKQPKGDRPPPPAVRSQTANSRVPKTPSETATLWPSVSECPNLVVIDLGPPPRTRIPERAVTLAIQLRPSVTHCCYFFSHLTVLDPC